MTVITATAKLFGQRPSTLLAIMDPVTALEFDLAAAVTALEAQKQSQSGNSDHARLWL